MFGLFKKQEVPKQWKVYASVAFAVMLAVNGLAGGTTLLGGLDTAAVSDKYANLFAPAGFTFAIWGVIYALLFIYLLRVWHVITTAKPRIKAKEQTILLQQFTLTSVLNIAWLFAWQYQVLWLSVLLMIALLVTLLQIQRGLSTLQLSRGESFTVRVPFSIYAGWITVATIANITTWLVSVGWNGGGLMSSIWMVIIVITGVIIGMKNALLRHDWVYLAVFVWAYFGILYKHMTVFNMEHMNVIITLAILLPVLIMTTLLLAVRRLR